MTLAEFKAWFEGFTEDMEGAPTAKQWKRIKDRVKQIDGTAITKEVIYRDRYWRDYWTVWGDPPMGVYSVGTAVNADAYNGLATAVGDLTALGKAEFADA